MRHFTSYGPVDPRKDFCVARSELVAGFVEQLVGDKEGGHYFTTWAPRQSGKTWLMRRAIQDIRDQHGDRFLVGSLSMQAVVMKDGDPPEAFLAQVPDLFRDRLGVIIPPLTSFREWMKLFQRGTSPFERPLILLIDEFDHLPQPVIDQLVTLFRDLYLNRETTLLHGLTLIGVRAVLGVDSLRGSPFNVQRSLRVPNLTHAEVTEMFRQYQDESGQRVAEAVIDTLYEMTRGQPGLVGWFGELLTEKYNPRPAPIDLKTWARVYAAACQVEPNNTMLNLLKKAKGPYLRQVLEIFARTDVPFSYGQDWCNFLSLNGVIDSHEIMGNNGEPLNVCRFSSPFVQQRLFGDLSGDAFEALRELPLDPLDTLADVFTDQGIAVPALLQRYVAYLGRLRQGGIDPWREQPRRVDLQHTEAVGHFHLYRWLCAAVSDECLVSPEFPTGNGTVDLVLRWRGHLGIIEVKSFLNRGQLQRGQEQAAQYAVKLKQPSATVAVFVPVTDEGVLQALSGERTLGAVTVTTIAISWLR